MHLTLLPGGLERRGAYGPAVRADAAVPRALPPPPATGPEALAGWRVTIRRPEAIEAERVAAWRALAGRATRPDPFADPDFLIPAARHAPHCEGGIAFAFVEGGAAQGADEGLAGVLPLVLAHPLRGGATHLWVPALAPRAIEPTFADGQTVAVVAALSAYLRAHVPGDGLCLSALGPGPTRRRLRAAGRIAIPPTIRPGYGPGSHPAVPEAQFVALARHDRAERMERVSAPEAVAEAVERFLGLATDHACAPLPDEPGAAAALRAVARALAHRGLVEVELGYAGERVVSGAVRLGPPGERMPWRAIRSEPDAAASRRPPRLALVRG